MTNEERLKKLMQIRDTLIPCYDYIRFNTEYNQELAKSFDAVKQVLQELQDLSDDYVDELPDCSKIIILEDAIIENGERVEVKTNITGLRLDDSNIEINLKGYIPSEGSLELSWANKEWGLEISAQNNIPTKVREEHGACGYHYSDPTKVKYFSPGIYRLEKGTVIGIMTQKNKTRSLVNNNQE